MFVNLEIKQGSLYYHTLTMHYYGEILQIYHVFALYDTPKMGNLMIPVKHANVEAPSNNFSLPIFPVVFCSLLGPRDAVDLNRRWCQIQGDYLTHLTFFGGEDHAIDEPQPKTVVSYKWSARWAQKYTIVPWMV